MGCSWCLFSSIRTLSCVVFIHQVSYGEFDFWSFGKELQIIQLLWTFLNELLTFVITVNFLTFAIALLASEKLITLYYWLIDIYNCRFDVCLSLLLTYSNENNFQISHKCVGLFKSENTFFFLTLWWILMTQQQWNNLATKKLFLVMDSKASSHHHH